jgi:hypothetical protein
MAGGTVRDTAGRRNGKTLRWRKGKEEREAGQGRRRDHRCRRASRAANRRNRS